MPPRIPDPKRLKGIASCLRPAALPRPVTPSFQPLIQKATLIQEERKKNMQAITDAYRSEQEKQRRRADAYQLEQAQQRRQSNIERQATLKAHRDVLRGDPVHGIVTPFLESFDNAGQSPLSEVKKDDAGNPLEQSHPLPTSNHILNFQLTKDELDVAIADSHRLTEPPPFRPEAQFADASIHAEEVQSHKKRHIAALEALHRITKLDNASGKDKRHANIRRIIEVFGRHNTDGKVRPKPLVLGQTERIEKIRGGPDTGSSEVQIAILTAKIRTLAQMYVAKKGNKDKHNKRNLRLLLHKRQKLLKYLKRRERGSGRWMHMIEKLGLTPATWEGQIEVR